MSEEFDNIEAVAVIGLSGRFPGAENADQFWRNLVGRVESITHFRDDELDQSIADAVKLDPDYVRARGVLADVDKFDAAFFNISPREAEILDPQQRIFLEICWAALENAGYDPDSYSGLIGLYAGMGNNTYRDFNLSSHPQLIESFGELQTMMANEKDYLTTRVSHKLNLKGPSLNVYTACSTALVAVCEAFHSLISYQCDTALAGGVSVTFPQNRGYLYQEGGIVSGDGHCRPFDAKAQGTVFGGGAGVVVLKRLGDAIEERDHIYAVIRGAAMNNDGASRVSFTAPSVDGQSEAIALAQAYADVTPDSISYVEAHGTATPLGDPIEIEALTRVFGNRSDKKQFCGIGSVKGNIGHVDAAAGVAGLIKVVLSLMHKKLPPTLHFENPNSRIDFSNSPFFVVNQFSEWEKCRLPRRAGVSSFGAGGTNAHVILEEAPSTGPSGASRPFQLIMLSAKTESALQRAKQNLAGHFAENGDQPLSDLAYTLQMGRKAFKHRYIQVSRNTEGAIETLQSPTLQSSAKRQLEIAKPDVVFMFPGQGAQYVNMGIGLYESEPVFKQAIDACSEILNSYLKTDLRNILYPENNDPETAAAIIRETQFTQPALFVVEYALAKLWMHWGVLPEAMLGHSIGEFVAACLAGVFSLEDALKLVATRATLMQELPAGAMLSVRLPAEEMEKILSPNVSIAAINGPSLCVISGPTDDINVLRDHFDQEGVVWKKLHTSHAFHSPMIDGIIDPFLEEVKKIKLSPPSIKIVSTVTADWLTPQLATDPDYWARHARRTVRFAEGVRTVWENPERVLLEVGPRATTSTLAIQQAKDRKIQLAFPSFPDTADDDREWQKILYAMGQLWLSGVSINWNKFYENEDRRRVPLPSYPFEQKRFWVEPTYSENDISPPVIHEPIRSQSEEKMTQVKISNNNPTVKENLIAFVREIFEEIYGEPIESNDENVTFFELGFDSLFLTQASLAIKRETGLNISFRQLIEDFPTFAFLSDYLEINLTDDMLTEILKLTSNDAAAAKTPSASEFQNEIRAGTPYEVTLDKIPIDTDQLKDVLAQQLSIISRQLDMISGISDNPKRQQAWSKDMHHKEGISGSELNRASATDGLDDEDQSKDKRPIQKPAKSFGPAARIDLSYENKLSGKTLDRFNQFFEEYTIRTAKSKKFTQDHRPTLADPRVVSGFSPILKEVTYPIVVDRFAGSRIWDIDGNEYIDMTNGFGSNIFGHAPAFIKEALTSQLDKGIGIGPQHPLAGEVAKLFCELTGHDRAAFCNTGSEAVLGAMRIARTVTGRNKIVIFSGSYHGMFDEVIVRGTKKLRSLPAAAGIPPAAVENIIVLDYGEDNALAYIKAHAHELAAIMVEPIQSRRPDLRPKDFLAKLRKIADQSGTVLFFDEIVTGFRVRLGGAQEYFGIQADLATYGKVIGGGMPIGVIAGRSYYMDALDGGNWQFGDSSAPEAGVTYFAGTFVRHPLVLAAAKATLEYFKQKGAKFQNDLNKKTEGLISKLHSICRKAEVPIKIDGFSSFFQVSFTETLPYASLLFPWLRSKGIFISEGRGWFLTEAHSDKDLSLVADAFEQCIAEMQEAGLLSRNSDVQKAKIPVSSNKNDNDLTYDRLQKGSYTSPVPGAKLGRDPNGKPGWYIPDPERPGKFLKVGDKNGRN